MYTGENTLRSIRTYISGYYHALLDLDGDESGKITAHPFHDWIAEKLGYYESTAGYVNMIMAEVLGFDADQIAWEEVMAVTISKEQHTQSIQRFYALLEEFKEAQQKGG